MTVQARWLAPRGPLGPGGWWRWSGTRWQPTTLAALVETTAVPVSYVLCHLEALDRIADAAAQLCSEIADATGGCGPAEGSPMATSLVAAHAALHRALVDLHEALATHRAWREGPFDGAEWHRAAATTGVRAGVVLRDLRRQLGG